ncbi:hypothetical protein EDD21DRAFT_301206 [Dissophora ornata]|nr:hypothetical protein EDD21DRAFT_301206 [Dissophora ornata]
MGDGELSRHRQSSSGDSNASRTRSPPSNQAQPRSSKKAPHELLTEAEKKANHIASEQKRRQNIRIGFDSLVEIVPTLSECHRSEALILQKSVDYIHRLLSQKNELKSRVRDLQVNLGEPAEDDDSVSVSPSTNERAGARCFGALSQHLEIFFFFFFPCHTIRRAFGQEPFPRHSSPVFQCFHVPQYKSTTEQKEARAYSMGHITGAF